MLTAFGTQFGFWKKKTVSLRISRRCDNFVFPALSKNLTFAVTSIITRVGAEGSLHFAENRKTR